MKAARSSRRQRTEAPLAASFAERIRPHVESELEAAARAEADGDPSRAFQHFERAHVLGQLSTRQHVRVHGRMLGWGWRQRDAREILGQLLRIAGAATKTIFGLVPIGNTGGSNVSPIRSMPVPADLAAVLEQARAGRTVRNGGSG